MMRRQILRVAIHGPFKEGLSYYLDQEVEGEIVGRRVRVPLRKRETIGVVIAEEDPRAHPEAKLKAILEVIDAKPIFSAKMRELISFMRDYYHVSIGDAYDTALPSLINHGKPLQSKRKSKILRNLENIQEKLQLSQEQEVIAVAIAQPGFAVHLLEGVTGSGKTEVYLECAESAVKAGKSVLVLVPEIGLTPQTIERFQRRLGQEIWAYHSGLSEAQKRDCWFAVLHQQAKIVIGTRSAVFLPFADLGLIVVDEEHDTSYKQQTGVHYSAKSIALMRGKMDDCPVILGTATPSVESYFLMQEGVYQHHMLRTRAKQKIKNRVHVVDMRKFRQESGLSKPLLEAMALHLQKGDQVLLFLNRRGYAPILLCDNCGECEKCPACEMSYTLHRNPHMLICHHCGRMARIPEHCSLCGGQLLTLGQGTEQLEEVIAAKFSNYPMVRLDQDTTRKSGELTDKLTQIKMGQVKIIIGTQMLAKGHDFPGITWVGVVDLDYGFFAPDFRAIERMGQLLTQVSGRAGRGQKAGEVMIQTHVPEHPLLQLLLREGYPAFLQQLLLERRAAHWPPFSHLALLRAEAKNIVVLQTFLEQAKQHLKTMDFISILGPIPAFVRKRNNFHRAQLLLESASRAALHKALSKLENWRGDVNHVRFWLDVDPLEVG